VLTGLEFFVAISFNSVPLLVVVALVKAALVVYFYMHVYKLNLESEGSDESSYEYKTGTNRLGLWLFLISDSFRLCRLDGRARQPAGSDPSAFGPDIGTGCDRCAAVSSFFMNRGETMMHNGDRKGFLNNTLITFLLGLGFLIGVVLWSGRMPSMKALLPAADRRVRRSS
jgi:hypothetical protein